MWTSFLGVEWVEGIPIPVRATLITQTILSLPVNIADMETITTECHPDVILLHSRLEVDPKETNEVLGLPSILYTDVAHWSILSNRHQDRSLSAFLQNLTSEGLVDPVTPSRIPSEIAQ